MKEHELRKVSKCGICGKGIAHTGLPLFYLVNLGRHGVDLQAARRQDGLAMMLEGNSVLANVMGPDEEMTIPVGDPITFSVCEKCAMTESMVIGELFELISEQQKEHGNEQPSE